MQSVRQKSRAAMLIVSAGLLCFTSLGCRSGLRHFPGTARCEGGACEAPAAEHHASDQTPAELFAEMNYEAIAAEQRLEAKEAVIASRVPRGPDSLFATMR